MHFAEYAGRLHLFVAIAYINQNDKYSIIIESTIILFIRF